MLKRYAVLGLVLLISGGIGLVRTLPYDPDWVELGLAPHAPMLANRSKTEVPVLWWSTEPPQDLKAELDRMRALSPETLQVQQAARLQADMERLAGGESPAPNLAQVLYGEDWQDKVAAYKAGKERNEFILTVSFVLTLVGLILFAWCVLVFLARCTIWAARRLWGLIAKVIHRPPDETPADAPPAQPQEHDVHPLERGRPGPHKRDMGRTRIAVQGVTPPVEEEPVIYQRSYPDPAQEDGHLNGAEVADEILERLWADEKARPAASLQVGEPDE